MVGIFADDVAQLVAFQQVVLTFTQMQRDLGAARGLVHHLDGEFSAAVGFPAHALVGLLAGAARQHRHLVGDDEGGIEAHAELADQAGVLLLIAGQPREEFARAGLGDGAEVVDHLVAAHADAVVAHGQGARFLVKSDADGHVRVVFEQCSVMQPLETQLVACVGSVGNQFAQENLAVGIQRMDHQVQQLLYLCLEAQCFTIMGLAVERCVFSHIFSRFIDEGTPSSWGCPEIFKRRSRHAAHHAA